MIKYPDDPFALAALGVIKEHDQSLFSQMITSDWEVRLARTVDDLITPGMPADEAAESRQHWGTAFAGTGSERSVNPGVTFLYVPYITEIADEKGMPVSEFTADVLAHEFTHYKGGSEWPAFREGARFACNTGLNGTVCTFAVDNLAMFAAQQLMGIPY